MKKLCTMIFLSLALLSNSINAMERRESATVCQKVVAGTFYGVWGWALNYCSGDCSPLTGNKPWNDCTKIQKFGVGMGTGCAAMSATLLLSALKDCCCGAEKED